MSGEDIEYLVNTKRTYNGISGVDKYRLQKETIYINGMEFVVRRLCSTSFESGPYGVVGWVIDEDIERCMVCGEEFGFFRHRHHCRACGNVVCYECSPDEAVIAEIQELGEQRVCIQCFWGQDPVEAKHSRIVDVAYEQATKRWTHNLQSDSSSSKSQTTGHIDYWSDVDDAKPAVAVPKRRYTYKEDDSDGDDAVSPAEPTTSELPVAAHTNSNDVSLTDTPPDISVTVGNSSTAPVSSIDTKTAAPTNITKRPADTPTTKDLSQKSSTVTKPDSVSPVIANQNVTPSSPKQADQELSMSSTNTYTPLETVDASEQEPVVMRKEAEHRTSNHVPFIPTSSSPAASTTTTTPDATPIETSKTAAPSVSTKSEISVSTNRAAGKPLTALPAATSPNAKVGASNQVSDKIISATAYSDETSSLNGSGYAPLETVDASEQESETKRKEAEHRTSNHVPFIPASSSAAASTPAATPVASIISNDKHQTSVSKSSKSKDATEQTSPKVPTNSSATNSSAVKSSDEPPPKEASPITNVSVTPQAVCVLKSRRPSGEKVFVNVLAFPMQLMLGNKTYLIDKDIVWLHGQCKKSTDKNGDECLAYDVVISDGAEKETALGNVSLQQLGMRVITEINLQYQDTLAMEFTTPKIRNNYKGEGPVGMTLFATNGKLFHIRADAEKHSFTPKEDPSEIRFLRTNSIPDNPLPEGIPAPHTGYLRKEGHLIRNWKRRYFTLVGGILQYFEKEGKDGKGEKVKGELSLKGAVVNTSGADKEYDSKKLYITAGEKGKDLFLEADTPAECIAWRNALFMHIEYATNNPDFVGTPRDSKSSRPSIFG